MILLKLLLIFVLLKKPADKELIRLLCRELEGHYNPLNREQMQQAQLLYSYMLVTGKCLEVSQGSGSVPTPFGVYLHPAWMQKYLSPDTIQRNRLIHLSASKRLRKIFSLISLSSSMLIPRLLTKDGKIARKYFGAKILSRVILKLCTPNVELYNPKEWYDHLAGNRNTVRCCLYVPRPFYGHWTMTSSCGHFKYCNDELNKLVREFLERKPHFSLNFNEVIDLIFWAFMEQDELKAQDAAMFGLHFSHTNDKRFLYTNPREILDIANNEWLLNRALSLFSIEKNEMLKEHGVLSFLRSITKSATQKPIQLGNSAADSSKPF
jgi:hypothetical protein